MAAEVGGLRVWADPDKTRAVLDLSGAAEYRLFTLQDPHRVVVDLPKSALDTSLEINRKNSGLIREVRHGAPEAGMLRIVLDLEERARLKSFMLEPTGQYGHRLVIDLYGEAKGQAASIKHVSDVQQPNRDIVIAVDAGHGGEDPGASGPKRTREKDVVLQIARRLKQAIDGQPGMRAVLTRGPTSSSGST